MTTIDGTSLGSVQPADWEIVFGEVSAERQPFVFVGDLLMECSVGSLGGEAATPLSG
jgi:hypothetical protein